MSDLGLSEHQEDNLLRNAKVAKPIGNRSFVYVRGVEFEVEMVPLAGFGFDVPRMRRRAAPVAPMAISPWYQLMRALLSIWFRP